MPCQRTGYETFKHNIHKPANQKRCRRQGKARKKKRQKESPTKTERNIKKWRIRTAFCTLPYAPIILQVVPVPVVSLSLLNASSTVNVTCMFCVLKHRRCCSPHKNYPPRRNVPSIKKLEPRLFKLHFLRKTR